MTASQSATQQTKAASLRRRVVEKELVKFSPAPRRTDVFDRRNVSRRLRSADAFLYRHPSESHQRVSARNFLTSPFESAAPFLYGLTEECPWGWRSASACRRCVSARFERALSSSSGMTRNVKSYNEQPKAQEGNSRFCLRCFCRVRLRSLAFLRTDCLELHFLIFRIRLFQYFVEEGVDD